MGWDQGLNYEEMYEKLLKELRNAELKEGRHALVRRLYSIILLTQLRNGIRLSEAIDFVAEVTRSLTGGEKPRKKFIIPEEVSKDDLLVIKGLLELKLSRGKYHFMQNITMWAKKRHGINTFSLSRALRKYLRKKYWMEVEKRRRWKEEVA